MMDDSIDGEWWSWWHWYNGWRGGRLDGWFRHSTAALASVVSGVSAGIYETLKACACISKYAGGIGLSIHNIRATNSYIRGTNGESNGIVPMLRVYNDTAR